MQFAHDKLINVLYSRQIKREDEDMVDQYSQSFVLDVNLQCISPFCSLSVACWLCSCLFF